MNDKKQIRLILDGDIEGLQRLADLQAEGKLEGLLNELRPDDFPFIKVVKAGFIEDKEVIQKAELIRDIQEGKADKELIFTNLSRASLRKANLIDANFSNVNLTNADFEGADLTRTNFSNANLTNANLKDAILTDTNFTNADLTGVTYS